MDSDWMVIRSRTSRVRRLCGQLDCEIINNPRFIDDEVFIALNQPPKPEPLFTRLVTIEWRNFWPVSHMLLRVAAGPSVLHLSFPDFTERFHDDLFSDMGEECTDTLSNLATLYPSVTSFNLINPPSMPVLVPRLSAAVDCWPNLVSLTCGELLPDVTHRLLYLPSLRSLTIRLPENIYQGESGADAGTTDQPATATLRYLHLTGDPEDTVRFLTKFPQKLLTHTLVLKTQVAESPTELLPLFEGVSTMFSPQHLEAITWFGDADVREFEDSDTSHYHVAWFLQPAMTFHSIEPLLAFDNLVSVELQTCRSISLCDADLEQMGRCWKHLRSLMLGSQRGWDSLNELPTVFGLATLIELLPDLETLAISLNGYQLSSMDDEEIDTLRARCSQASRSLRSLDLLDTMFDESATIAAKAIAAVVPEACEVDAWNPRSFGIQERYGYEFVSQYQLEWARVDERLKMLRAGYDI
ncbi:hypothetical protein CONPUDRAFT_164358 [Coniophora puteana RWD-64-598 SS2]|uniref:F-box domain-containing protein n=1 Tax=Coniophora puteana (strain RWD-64-598) TaxID=741705 RepID=A0A5M3MWF7_CONPW|nr:uncharacterized protein CONPUDRAFT_164358 [Coniophora puteana RWD-64-598 SS2]EIW83400.1 hypothetical protein CONPUDRAFT_164358 [Coniophora puteana RWD-64-598 SS2]